MFFSVLQLIRCEAAKLSTSSSACPLFTSTLAAETWQPPQAGHAPVVSTTTCAVYQLSNLLAQPQTA